MLKKLKRPARPDNALASAANLVRDGGVTPILGNSVAASIFGGAATIAKAWAEDEEIRSPPTEVYNCDLARVAQYRLPTEGEWEQAALHAGVREPAGTSIWDWTSTLWGDDRRHPEFPLPYRPDDGRERKAPSTGPYREYRICRGGPSRGHEERLDLRARKRYPADSRNRRRGFRVALTV